MSESDSESEIESEGEEEKIPRVSRVVVSVVARVAVGLAEQFGWVT